MGALPGMLVQGLRKVGTSNPLILLDELDKVGTSNFHGDPSAALLETLDPAQNWSFKDQYVPIPRHSHPTFFTITMSASSLTRIFTVNRFWMLTNTVT